MVDRIMKTSPAGITVVNLDGRIIFANQRAQEILGLTADKITGLTHDAPLWRITDYNGNPFPGESQPFVQVLTSGNSVHGVRYAINPDAGQRLYLSINGAPIFDESGHISEVVFSIDDVTEQRHAEEKIIETMEKLRKSLNDTIRTIAMIAEARDPYTAGHQERVSKLAAAIAEVMKLPEEQIQGVRIAGIIHDIGKMQIPAEILSKPVKLSPNEFELVKSHAEIGYGILSTIEFPYPIAEITYQHHERIDGSGYPRGLKGEEILIEARILAAADTVEAMASDRPYRPALGISSALTEIEKNSGIMYDAGVVEACLRLFREKGYTL
jgi:PAS domain S-box-containing protein/putative nucleotidyltransferase with HDIG domain